MTTQAKSRNTRRLVGGLIAMTVGMFAFGYVLVPLYDLFCEVTGLNGKTRNQAAEISSSSAVDDTRTVTVQFLANLNVSAPWEFAPSVVKMRVHPGQLYQTSYSARNLTGESQVAQAIPSVSPGEAAAYMQKVECFCFNRQDFEPGEVRDMPLVFRLDPALPADISTVTLSYTFFRISDQGG